MIYGDRVRQVRELHGFTQTRFANELEVTQSTIARIENDSDSLEPSEDLLARIAMLTRFPPSFFRQPPSDDLPMGSLLYRSRESVSGQKRAKAWRLAQLYFESVDSLRQQLNVPPVRLPRTLEEDPITAARLTRSALGFPPTGPIKNLVAGLERGGVIIVALPLHIEGLDAFSLWPAGHTKPPVIALLETSEGDRQRFSTAHEVGELVLHQRPAGTVSEMEQGANRFAAEFLLPAESISEDLIPPVTLGSVAELKPRWGVSMQALIRRARGLDIITTRQYHYLFEQLGARNWKIQEPANLRIAPEQPRALSKMIELLYGKDVDISRLANELSRSEQFLRTMLTAHSWLGNSASEPSPSGKLLHLPSRKSHHSQQLGVNEPID
jgi:Zn-dependent peptidase ImmA (M78 family)/DNA-binding XRE family transcriptional regulator